MHVARCTSSYKKGSSSSILSGDHSRSGVPHHVKDINFVECEMKSRAKMCSAKGTQKGRLCIATASSTHRIGETFTEVFALQHTGALEDGKPYSFITHSVVAHIVRQTKKEDSEN